MTTTEERLRTLFQDMAEEARPVVLLGRLDDRAPALRRRRMVTAVAAAAAAVVAVAVSTVFVESRLSSMPQPAYDPPEVFELPQTATARPGTAALAVSLVDDPTVSVVPAGDTAPVSVLGSDSGSPWPARLSPDGTRMVVVDWEPSAVEVLDLTTGEVARLDVDTTYAADVSPDNRTVAVSLSSEVQLLDIGTGEADAVIAIGRYRELDPFAPALGWSPDGTRLALHDHDNLVIVDRHGVELVRRSGMKLVNSSQAWSPDSKSLLVFDVERSKFVVQPVHDGDPTVLTAPTDAVRPMGWAGDRVVWLAGQPGAQRLVAADPDGGDAETWLRFDVGNAPVESVSWSRDLSG